MLAYLLAFKQQYVYKSSIYPPHRHVRIHGAVSRTLHIGSWFEDHAGYSASHSPSTIFSSLEELSYRYVTFEY
jgi:hypothetical protein